MFTSIDYQPFNLQPFFLKSGSRKAVLQTRIFFWLETMKKDGFICTINRNPGCRTTFQEKWMQIKRLDIVSIFDPSLFLLNNLSVVNRI